MKGSMAFVLAAALFGGLAGYGLATCLSGDVRADRVRNLRAWYHEGYQAGRHGYRFVDCPYPDSEQAVQWKRGLNEGRISRWEKREGQ